MSITPTRPCYLCLFHFCVAPTRKYKINKLQETLLGVQSELKMFQNLGDSHHHLEKLDNSTYFIFQSEKLPLVQLGWFRWFTSSLRGAVLRVFGCLAPPPACPHRPWTEAQAPAVTRTKQESEPSGQESQNPCMCAHTWPIQLILIIKKQFFSHLSGVCDLVKVY